MIDVWKKIQITGKDHSYYLSVYNRVEDSENIYIEYETKYDDVTIPVRKEDIQDLIKALQDIEEEVR